MIYIATKLLSVLALMTNISGGTFPCEKRDRPTLLLKYLDFVCERAEDSDCRLVIKRFADNPPTVELIEYGNLFELQFRFETGVDRDPILWGGNDIFVVFDSKTCEITNINAER